MSKAFTKEDEGNTPSEEPLPPRSSAPQPVTPAGLARLRAEHAALAARAGAPSPADARRAKVLARMLETVYPLEPKLQDGGAGFGAFVTFEDEEGRLTTYQLTGPDEADLAAGRLSVASPIARALLGRKVGDTVVLKRPKGDAEVTVREVTIGPAE